MDFNLMTTIFNDLATAGEFRPFDRSDWDGFAGAEEGSLITYGKKYAFILSPSLQLAACDETGECVFGHVVSL